MPAPFLIARSMTSRETLAFRAFSTTAASRGFPASSAPPSFAATIISLTSLPTTWPFLSPATSRFAWSHWRPMAWVYQLQRGSASEGLFCSRRPVGDVRATSPIPALRTAKPLQKKQLFAKQKQHGRSDNADRNQRDVIRDEVRIRHQREANEHRLPDVHPFPVDERDEADRAEDQSANEIRAAENWHGVFRANSAPIKLDD